MKRVVYAFALGLGMGASVGAFRFIQRARAGLPSTQGALAGGREPDLDAAPGAARPVGGPARELPARGLGRTQVGAGDAVGSVGERLRSAVQQGILAARETEEELRSKVLNGGR